MNAFKLKCFVITAMVVMGGILADVYADIQNKWQPQDGVSVRQGYHTEWFRGGERRDVGTNAGEIGLVWSDTRRGDRDVYLQIIDTDGNPKFEEGGLAVASASGRQEDPAVWPDPDGGWFVVWSDFANWIENGELQGDSLGNIYCTKVSANGEILWGGERGVPVIIYPGIQEDVRIVHDGRGGCIIAWRDQRGGDVGNIYAMHITSEGQVNPDWTEFGVGVVVAPGPQVGHTADIDGAGGMIIAWKDGRGGESNIWAQRINSNGELLWGDGQGIIVCNNPANLETPRLCPDGAGGAFIAWGDDRNFDQTHKDIYINRVNAQGQLLWGAANEGAALVTAPHEQAGLRIIVSEAGSAIVMWEDKRGNGDEIDIYGMRVSGANALERMWEPANGKALVVAERNQMQSRLYADGQGGAYLVWEDERDGGYPEIDLWAQRINIQGNPVWDAAGIPVCRAIGLQHSPLVRTTADGGALFTWADLRSGSQDIFIQNVRANGTAVWDRDGVPLVEGIGGNGTRPNAIKIGENSVAVVWLDGRYGRSGVFPFIQYVSNSNDAPHYSLRAEGFPVIEINESTIGGGINPQAIPDGQGGTIVVWEDHRRSLQRYAIFAQRIAANGERLWGTTGLRVADFAYDQNDPRITTDDNGGVIIAWRGLTGDDVYDIYVQRLNAEGNRLWGDSGIQLSDNMDEDETVQSIVPDGLGGAAVVWLKADWTTDDDLLAQRVDANGEFLWGDEGIIICNEINKQRNAVMVRHQNGFVVAWVDGRDDESGLPENAIFAQFINNDGTFKWRNGGSPICIEENHQENPSIAIDNNGYIWFAWEDNRFAGTARARDIFIQKVHHNTNHLGYPIVLIDAPPDGIAICASPRDQVNPSIIHDGQNGMYIVWEDNRDGVWADIYGLHLQEDASLYNGWDANGTLISMAYHKQEQPRTARFNNRGENGTLVTWEDKRATGKEELSDIYVQRIDDMLLSVDRGEHAVHPSGFEISSVHPNPFNSQSLISFTMRNEGNISLSLYDVSGRLVDELTSGWWSAGRHLYVLDANDLAAGTYIVRLTTQHGKVERKLQLVK